MADDITTSLQRNSFRFLSAAHPGPSPLAGMVSLEHLDLSQCEIDLVPAGFFDGLAGLVTLILSDNLLSDAQPSLLPPFPKLDVLDLSFNQLTAVPARYTSGSSLRSISFRSNPITTVGEGAFSASDKLQSVDMSRMPLDGTTLDGGTFAGSRRLSALDFDKGKDASFSGSVAPEVFAGLESLEAMRWPDLRCPAGYGATFEEGDGAAAAGSMCIRCAAGTHKASGPGSLLSCTPCESGWADADADPVTACVACPAGAFTSAASVGPCSSFLCPPGTIDADGRADTDCVACPAGTYTPAGTASEACLACPEGTTDIDSDPATPCSLCGAGTRAPINRTGSCISDSEGSASSQDTTIVLSVVFGILFVLLVIAAVLLWRKSRERHRKSKEQLRLLKTRVQRQFEQVLQGASAQDCQRVLRGLEVPRSWITTTDRLGQGAFGVVDLGTVQRNGSRYQTQAAVKRMDRRGVDEDDQEAFLLEVQLTALLKHPNIVRVIAVCTSDTPFVAALEYMPGGDLKTWLGRAESQPLAGDLISVASQLASALVFIKARGVVHRDLAARNCLVGESLATVKLADFGMSRALEERDYYRKVRPAPGPRAGGWRLAAGGQAQAPGPSGWRLAAGRLAVQAGILRLL